MNKTFYFTFLLVAMILCCCVGREKSSSNVKADELITEQIIVNKADIYVDRLEISRVKANEIIQTNDKYVRIIKRLKKSNLSDNEK